MHVTHGDPVGLWIRLEDGSVRAGLRQLENHLPDLDGRLVGEATFELPGDLPLGYPALHPGRHVRGQRTLIVVPAKLELPPRLGGKRTWGLATQLYSVQSQRSWGVGDLTDLADLAVWSGANHGAGTFWSTRCTRPPRPPRWSRRRMPTSRRYVNPLYLRPEAIPEFAEARSRGRIRKHAPSCRRAAHGLIDRDAAWAAKRDVLKRLPG